MKLLKALLVIAILLVTYNSVIADWGHNVELVDCPIYKQIGPGIIIEDYMFATNGLGLVVLSVEDIEDISVVAHLPFPDRALRIAYYDGYVYISTTNSDRIHKIYIINVNNPAQPEIENVWIDEDVDIWFWFHEDRMYMKGSEGFTCFSLDDPTHPEALPHPIGVGSPTDVAFQGDYAVTNTGHVIDLSEERMIDYSSFECSRGILAFNGDVLLNVGMGINAGNLETYDFSNPERVDQLSSGSGGGLAMAGDYWLQDNFIFLRASNHIRTFNISNPSSPRRSGELTFDDVPSSNNARLPFARVGNHLFVVDEINQSRMTSVEKIQVIDTSNPSDLSIISEVTFPLTSFTYFSAQDNLLFTKSTESLYCWDISDWRNPIRRSVLGDQDEIWRVYGFMVTDDLCYLDHEQFLKVISYENPTDPQLVSETEIARRWEYNFAVNDNYIYSDGRQGRDIYNIEDPESPELENFMEGDFSRTNVKSQNGFLITESGNALNLYDLSDPVEPGLVDSDTLANCGFIYTLAARDSFVYVASATPHGEGGRFIDLHIYGIDSVEHELHYLGVSPEDDISLVNSNEASVVVGDDGVVLLSSWGGLLIYDVEDPYNPHLIADHPAMYRPYGVLFHEGQILINDHFGIGIYELTVNDVDPTTRPGNLNFEETLIENITEMTLSLSNPAEEGLIHITGLEIEGDVFSVRNRGRWLTPEDVWRVAVTFQPDDAGDYEGVLLIEVDGNESVEVLLSGRGVLEIVNEDNVQQPGIFRLFPIHPNPFNSTTTIRYSLPMPTDVSLKVYNSIGQEVMTLISGFRQSGVHTSEISANNLPSGLYFVQLKASDQVFTQKVMLIR
ncbi:MAG: T9SS type A sorting domain-containing protein [Calditrichaeota bacterium]|nr:T9SS type A sorting domain-containing protein [Calditrichota bacterium]